MSTGQLLGIIVGLSFYAIAQILIYLFNWTKVMGNKTIPDWEKGYHKLTILVVTFQLVLTGVALWLAIYALIGKAFT